jgi:hypothetical protein
VEVNHGDRVVNDEVLKPDLRRQVHRHDDKGATKSAEDLGQGSPFPAGRKGQAWLR